MRSQSEEEPYLKKEKIDHYVRILSYIDRSIALQEENAEYLSAKADYLLGAIDNGLEDEIPLEEREVANLFKGAMKLNPLNYEYHLKLGWFYRMTEEEAALSSLSRSRQLYPTEAQVYLYLSRYYIIRDDAGKAFSNILLCFYHSGPAWRKMLDALWPDIGRLPQMSLNEEEKRFTFTLPVGSDEFYFKKEGFPHARLGMRMRIYTNKTESDGEVVLCNDRDFSVEAERVYRRTEDFNIYQHYLGTEPGDVYLDELIIRSAPPLVIEKIEFSKK